MSPGNPTTRRYGEVEKDRAVSAARQLRKELGSDHATVKRVAGQLGIGVAPLRSFVRQAEIDDGVKPGLGRFGHPTGVPTRLWPSGERVW